MSIGFAPAGGSSTDHGPSEERALLAATQQIALAYPWASLSHIATILRANFEATREAKVQDYRLVLAERNTRVRLRQEARRG
jgi:hypothetical protein